MSTETEENAELTITLLDGQVDSSVLGSKVYIEVRLHDQIRRFSPVDVEEGSGRTSYEQLPGVKIKNFALDRMWESSVHVVMRYWTKASQWADAAQIIVPIQTVGIREECEYRTFHLEYTRDNLSSTNRPILVLKMTLTSPYRSQVESVARLVQGYTTSIDHALDVVSVQTSHILPYLNSRYILVPAIPMGVFILASLPLAIVLGIVGLPVLVPIFLVTTAIAAVFALVAGAVWAGSRTGRARVLQLAKPILERLDNDPKILYPIGPPPSPVRVARSILPYTTWPKLVASIIIDLLGISSYAIPLFGEAMDVVWAPISFVLIESMYSSSVPWAGVWSSERGLSAWTLPFTITVRCIVTSSERLQKWFGALEELLPFTDIIPTATIAWITQCGPTVFHCLREVHIREDWHPEPRVEISNVSVKDLPETK